MESSSMCTATPNVDSVSPKTAFIHRHFILLKAHYFLFFSAFGILYPVLNITLRSRGLTDTELAYINLIIPFLVFFTNPLVGFIADHSRRYLLTYNCILASVTILYGFMFLLPNIKFHNIEANIVYDDKLGRVLDFCASQDVAIKCSSRSECGCLYSSTCTKDNVLFHFSFTMNPNDTRQTFFDSTDIQQSRKCGIPYRVAIDKYLGSVNEKLSDFNDHTSSLSTCEITCSTAHYCHGVRYPQQILLVLLYSLLFVIGTNLISIAITIGASIGFAALPRREIFGEQRMWGTVGFGVSALLASRLYDYFKSEFVYIIMFSIATLLNIVVTSFIYILPYKNEQTTTNHIQNSDDLNMKTIDIETNTKNKYRFKTAALIPLLKNIDVIVFLSLALIWGISYAPLDPYVYLYIDEITPCASRSIIGWMSLIAATAEVLAIFVAARMLKLLGMNTCSVIILIAFAVRFGGYYFIRRPYFLLFMETMHYFNFGILYVLIAQKADAIAPPGLAGTLQGFVYGLSFGLGRGIGLIASSFIYTRLQSRVLFLIFAIFDAAAALLYGLYFFVTKTNTKKSTHTNNNLNIPKIVIEPETIINEEPLLYSTSADKSVE